ARQHASSATAENITELIEEFKREFEDGSIENALKMLKKDRFQLSCAISDQEVIGVIRSQTDKTLVYACTLSNEGKFSCCTQNLRPCGGLRGQLCKHILLLIIGLVSNERLDSTTALRWALLSLFEEPKLDKTKMSQCFVDYAK